MTTNSIETVSMKYPGMQIDKKEVKKLFEADLNSAEDAKKQHYVDMGKPLPQNDFKELQEKTIKKGQAYTYLSKRLMKTRCGRMAVIVDDAVKIQDLKEEFQNYYGKFIKGLHPVLGKVLFNELDSQNLDEWKLAINQGGKMIDDEKRIINLCKEPAMYVDDYEPTEQDEELTNRFFDYVLNVLCSGKADQSEYILDWLSLVMRMEQTQQIIVLYTRAEGTGKSKFSEFTKALLGDLQTKLSPKVLEGKDMFTFHLAGCSLALVEELPELDYISKDQSLKFLKDIVTCNSYKYRQMREEGFELPCFLNVLVTTNYELDKGRRMVIPDVSTRKVQDRKYFAWLDECLESKTAMRHLFNVLWKRPVDRKKFRQGDIDTEAKKNYLLNTLRTPVHFLKDSFVLPKKNIDKIRRCELYADYVAWCKENKYRDSQIQGKANFFKEVLEMGVEFNKTRIGQCDGVFVAHAEHGKLADMMKRLKVLDDDDFAEFQADQETVLIESELSPEEQIKNMETEIARLQAQIMYVRRKHMKELEPVEIIKESDVIEKVEKKVVKTKKEQSDANSEIKKMRSLQVIFEDM